MKKEISEFKDAVVVIKDAIIRSRYQAATLVNKELLCLYYAVGKFVSDNSRVDFWGQGAVQQISENLQRELPGLRGFSEVSIKRMRIFYEEWQPILTNRPLTMDDLTSINRPLTMGDLEPAPIQANRSLPMSDLEITPIIVNRPLPMDDLAPALIIANRSLPMNDLTTTVLPHKQETFLDLTLLLKHIANVEKPDDFADSFLRLGFTHHYEVLAKEKSLEGRVFYISRCAAEFWSVETLKSRLRGDFYSKAGSLPNNFMQTLPEHEQARRAIRSFKEEYFLDHINIEDEIDPDERLIERKIVQNIKQFILSFGTKFCFIGNQYRVMVDGQEFFIDLLFFNRELRCLVAIELKHGTFKPSHLGQLNFYLSALDEYVRQADEAPSIGIILCKEANRRIVEFAVRDYTKPMGVATYKTRNEMPEKWVNALPDFDDMKKLLEHTDEP